MNEENNRHREIVREITVEILDTVLGLAESLTLIGASRKELYRVLMGKREWEWTVRKIAHNLQSLKQRGYIEIRKEVTGDSIIFTNRAKLKMLEKIADNSRKENEYLFISFDIPERNRKGRDNFRSVVKRLGFRQIQKSLWVTNKDVINLVEMAAQEYKVENYLVYLLTNRTNIDMTINKILSKST